MTTSSNQSKPEEQPRIYWSCRRRSSRIRLSPGLLRAKNMASSKNRLIGRSEIWLPWSSSGRLLISTPLWYNSHSSRAWIGRRSIRSWPMLRSRASIRISFCIGVMIKPSTSMSSYLVSHFMITLIPNRYCWREDYSELWDPSRYRVHHVLCQPSEQEWEGSDRL